MVRVRVPKSIFKDLEKQVNKRVERAIKKPKFEKLLQKAVVEDHIKKGKSPVAGKGKFKKYSESYKKAIRKRLFVFGKRIRPVNIMLSGHLLSTFFVKVNKRTLSIGFKDEVAEWINGGTNKMPRRPLLPTEGNEVFNKNIKKDIRRFLDRNL
jgi:hypothetical protein